MVRPQFPPRWRHLAHPCVLLGLGLVLACASGEEQAGGLNPPPPSSGSLTISISGLDAGVPATVSVSGPGGFHQSLTAGASFPKLTPGSYTITATEVAAGGQRWAPDQSSQTVQVVANGSAAAQVQYQLVTGSLTVTVSGLPPGTPAGLTLTGPGGFSAPVSATQTFAGLTPGSYTLAGVTVVVGSAQYAPALPGGPVAVAAGATPAEAQVAFARVTGSLTFAATGLPSGVDAPLTVTGPGGFSTTTTTGAVLAGLDPGSYAVSPGPVQHTGHTWSPTSGTIPATITAGPVSVPVGFAITTGGLTVAVSGLPGGTDAAVQVTGPGGFGQALTGTAAMVGLAPGSYTIQALPVSVGGQVYTPQPAVQVPGVSAGTTPILASVAYSPTLGSLSITIAGLPGGAAASVTVTGSGGFSQNLTGSTALSGLAPGTYTITANPVSAGGQQYGPAPVSQNVAVTGGAGTSATVTYAQTTGNLSVTVSGLPGGVSASVTVTGPGGFNQSLSGSAVLTGLVAGSYTVAAATVSSGGQTWTAAPLSQAASVAAGSTAGAGVTYTLTGPATSLNLRIDGVYLTQAAQRYDGSTPLVAGRDAYLRVFVLANEANTVAPAVRIRLYHGTTLMQTSTVTAPGGSVPQTVNEGVLTASWNLLVPGDLVQPTLRVLADVDPTGVIAETSETDNAFPVSGSPGAVDVRALPTFNIRFVPVLQSVNGLEGVVNAGNMETFLAESRKLLPIGAYSADLRATYTTNAPVLQSNNGNNAWGTILSEVLALRSADGSSRYYYGVVKTTYTSGVAGIGYVGGSARTSLGWDRLPSGSGVMAHELGHNMGRSHAPCGGVSGADPSYPYAGGRIGIWGLDVAALSLKDPSVFADLMGYCSPDWVSDYNWAAMVSYRQGGPNNIVAVQQGTGRGLLVWGRITPGGPVLEPAFVIDAPIALPAPGAHRVEALAADGTVLLQRSFAAVPIGDLPGGTEEGFAFVLPLERALELEMTRLRVVGPSGTAEWRPAAPAEEPAYQLTRDAQGRGVVRWDAARFPMVLIRDAASGQILSFARGGEVRLPATASRLRLTASDGVRSRTSDAILR